MRRSRHKTLVSACVICATALAIGVAGTYAFLASSDSEVNHFAIGHNTIEIREQFTPPATLSAGATIPKKVQVANTGSAPCFVRVLIEFSDASLAQHATLDLNTREWTAKQPDGYYYYKSALEAGGSTTPLITTVSVANNAPAESLGASDVIVYAESVQAIDEQGKRFASALAAFEAFSQKGQVTS